MNTTELKKLAEAATTWDMDTYRAFYAAANPAAILELLEVTNGLAEALNQFVTIYGTDDVRGWMAVRDAARAALAKYEGVQSALTKDQS